MVKKEKVTNFPFVSILIPIRNEAAHIQHCLDAVLSQDYPSDRLEILIADGMSTDGTRDKLQTLQEKHNHMRVYDNPKGIVSTGLNTLIRHTKSEIFIRVDGHTIINTDYVRNCVTLLQSSGADNVGGCMNARGENYFGKIVALATTSPFGVGGARFHYSDHQEWVDTVYMGAWKRAVFEKIGLFDEELVRNQDDEFNYRLRQYGGKILLSPRINSYYVPRGSIKTLWRQYFQYGFWKVRVLQKHPKQMSPRQFIPPAFVLVLFLGLLFSLIFPWGWLTFTALVSIYLLSNLSASTLIASRKGRQYFWTLPIAFATIHISYGSGFLAGLVKFWDRWDDKIGDIPHVKLGIDK